MSQVMGNIITIVIGIWILSFIYALDVLIEKEKVEKKMYRKVIVYTFTAVLFFPFMVLRFIKDMVQSLIEG